MNYTHNPSVLTVQLLNLNQAVSMFFSLCCCFAGFGVIAAVKELNNVAAHVDVMFLLSGCILVVSGIHHTTSVINQISDPYLFYFYNKLNVASFKSFSEDPSVYFVGGSTLLLSALIWSFMYSSGLGDAMFAAFATSALIPILAMSIRIRKRLNLYRQVHNTPDEIDDV